MAKKDKKIEIQLIDAKVEVSGKEIDGYAMVIGKRSVGQIVELEDQFATVEQGALGTVYQSMDQAVESIIENYNLNH